MRIVTPNHGLTIDTFIMYGIVRTIAQEERAGEYLDKIEIEPQGEYYYVELPKTVSNVIERNFYSNLHEAFKKEIEEATAGKSRQIAALQREDKVFEDIGGLTGLVKECKQPPNISDLYQMPSAWEEWRSERCRLHIKEFKQVLKERKKLDFTAQIALSPQLGKYLYCFDEGVKPTSQKLCFICTSLAILGLVSYSVRMLLMERGIPSGWQFLMLVPRRKVTVKKLSSFRLVFGKDRLITSIRLVEKMPEILTPLLLFKDADTGVLDSLLASSPMLYAYRFEPTGKKQVMAVRKVSEYPASRFIEFYLNAKKQASESDLKNLELMKRVEYSSAFSSLSLSILSNDPEYFYQFLRDFATESARRTGKLRFFSDAFISKALGFYSKH